MIIYLRNKKKLVSFIVVCVINFSLGKVSFAAEYDLFVSCSLSDCEVTQTTDPLFLNDNIYPTWGATKIIKAVNTSSESRIFQISVSPSFSSDSSSLISLSDSIEVTILEDSKILYGPKTVTEFKKDGLVTLSEVTAGQTKYYFYRVYMRDVGNEYQGKKLSFDMDLGFSAIPPPPPPPPPVPREDSPKSKDKKDDNDPEQDVRNEKLGFKTERSPLSYESIQEDEQIDQISDIKGLSTTKVVRSAEVLGASTESSSFSNPYLKIIIAVDTVIYLLLLLILILFPKKVEKE